MSLGAMYEDEECGGIYVHEEQGDDDGVDGELWVNDEASRCLLQY